MAGLPKDTVEKWRKEDVRESKKRRKEYEATKVNSIDIADAVIEAMESSALYCDDIKADSRDIPYVASSKRRLLDSEDEWLEEIDELIEKLTELKAYLAVETPKRRAAHKTQQESRD